MMKIKYFFVALLCIAVNVFSSCGEDEPNVPDLKLSVNSLELAAGQTSVVDITSGNPDYTITSSNDAVATAIINNDNKALTVTAISAGSVIITVKDAKNKTATVEITVNTAATGNSFVFVVNGVEVPDGAVITEKEIDEGGIAHSLIRIKKITEGTINTTLLISVTENSENTVGYCGWAFSAICFPVVPGGVRFKTYIVDSTDELDPIIESLGPLEGSMEVKYELSYDGKQQTITWICNYE